MKSYIYFICLCLYVCSCSSNIQSSYDYTIDINAAGASSSTLKLSEFVNKVDVIRLETNERCMVSNIAKIQFFGNKIYLLDNILNRLFIFDESGHFINVLNKVGGGPGEYIQLIDFSVNEYGIHLLDISSGKINHYGFDLKFIDKTSFNSAVNSFFVIGDAYWIYNGDSFFSDNKHQLIKINKTGKIVEKHFPHKKAFKAPKYRWNSSNVFQEENETLYFSPQYSSSIYMQKDEAWKSSILLSFGSKAFPESENVNDHDITSDAFRYILRNNFYVFDKYIVVDFFVDNQRAFSFFNKRTNTVQTGVVHNDLVEDYERFFPRWSSENLLIESVDAEFVLEDFKGLLHLRESLGDLQHDDNPLLVVYHLNRE